MHAGIQTGRKENYSLYDIRGFTKRAKKGFGEP